MSQNKILSVILTRGTEFDSTDPIVLKHKYGSLPQDDGGVDVPQLEHIEKLTYKQEQQLLVRDEIEAMKRPQLILQPLFFNIQIKVPATIKLFPSALPPAPDCDPPQSFQLDPKPFIKQEEQFLYQQPRRNLLYNRLFMTKEFQQMKGIPPMQLRFESRFEGGNLFQAVALPQNLFELHVQPDAPTPFHCQQFCFKVQNIEKNTDYTFKLMNLCKQVAPIQPIALLDGKYFPIGTNICCWRSGEMQKTEFWYQRIGEYSNIQQYQDSEDFKRISKDFKTWQKKRGMKKKAIAKAMYAFETNVNAYHFSFTIRFPHDVPELQLSSFVPYTYTNTLQYLEKLSSDSIRIETKQMCRSYFGNPIPIVKMYVGSEQGKNFVLILSRIAPSDSQSQLLCEGVLDEFLGRLDNEFVERIEAARQTDQALYQQLLQQFQKHKENRLTVLSRYVFFIVPSFNVDGQLCGCNRVNVFLQDYNRMIGQPGGYKCPQVMFVQQLIKYAEQIGQQIEYCFDLKTSTRVSDFVIDANEPSRYEELRAKIWDILGRLGAVPVLGADTKLFPEQGELLLDEQRDKNAVIKQFGQQLKAFIEERQLFTEFAEFGELRKQELFSFEKTTFTAAPPAKEFTARAFFGARKAKAFTVVAPKTYSTKQLRQCGRELVKFMMYQVGDEKKEEVERLQGDYLEWVQAALLQQFTSNKMKLLDMAKLGKENAAQLPDKLRVLSLMEDEEKYGNLIKMNERIQVRQALQINLEQQNKSDSDDSEANPEVGSGIPKKQTQEELQAIQDKIAGIKFIFIQAYGIKPGEKK